MFLIVLIVAAVICCVTSSRAPNLVLSTDYEDIREGQRLVNSLIADLTVLSVTKCALNCNKNSLCRSFNFCSSGRCELSGEDVYSTEDGENVLEHSTTCQYFGMKKTAVPGCQEQGTMKNIQNDSDSGYCQINLKRVDAVFGPWKFKQTTIDDGFEWKTEKERSVMLDAAHGGISGSTVETNFWYKFVKTFYIWSKARDNCARMGGKLFFKLNGTAEQLYTLNAKMGVGYWVGVYKETVQLYRDVDGNEMDPNMLSWNLGEPNGGMAEPFVLGGYLPTYQLVDAPSDYHMGSICDMM